MFSVKMLMETINIIDKSETIEVDYINFRKITFIYNAIQRGLEVKLRGDKYIFTKKHEGKKEVFLDTYLRKFIEKNMDIGDLIKNN